MESTDERIRKRRTLRNPMLIMGILMITLFFSLAIVLLVFPEQFDIQPEARMGFAAVLSVYGAYRAWRIYVDHVR